MYSAAIFDFDGTLVDSENRRLDTYIQAFKDVLGLNIELIKEHNEYH